MLFRSFDLSDDNYHPSTVIGVDNYLEIPITIKEDSMKINVMSFQLYDDKNTPITIDKKTKEAYVLEVNAQCGLSEDENYTSIGAILRYANQSFTELVIHIINDAFARRKK